MRKIIEKKSKSNIKFKFECFDSIGEVIESNHKRECKDDWKNRWDKLTDKLVADNESFFGCSSIEEAYGLIKDGWTEGTKSMLGKVEKIGKTQNRVKVMFENHQVGFAPNVARAVQNMPNCMIRAKRIPVKSKIVTIIFDSCSKVSTSSNDFLQAGLNVLELIIGLEARGYRVNLKVARGNYNKSLNEVCVLICDVKKASEPINLKKIAFPIAHPSWFRIVAFDWQEKSPITPYVSQRGQSYYIAVDVGNVKSGDMESVLDNNVFYITHKDAILGVDNLVNKIKLAK